MLPDGHVGYTTNSGGRGTLDLLWSCLVTIALCTWTIQRLQIIPWATSKTIVFRKKAFWFLVTLLCPEYIAWIAFEQWQRARGYRVVRELEHNDWTMQHGFYVDMGGFQIELEGKDYSLLAALEPNSDVLELDDCVRFTIRLDDLISLLKAGVLATPRIYCYDLDERSKNDLFAQVVTSLQVLYFVVNCCSRLGSNLPISTLEVSTVAFACCAAFVQYFWWYKPLDLRSTTVMALNPCQHARFISLLPSLRFNRSEQDLAEKKRDFKLFFDRILPGGEMNGKVIHGLWIGFVFNGIHVSSWNYSFASETEQLLWRTAGLGACGAIALLWAATFIRPRMAGLLLCSLSTIFYCVCRAYLLVEVFVGLRSVPGGLYQSPAWENALPGI